MGSVGQMCGQLDHLLRPFDQYDLKSTVGGLAGGWLSSVVSTCQRSSSFPPFILSLCSCSPFRSCPHSPEHSSLPVPRNPCLLYYSSPILEAYGVQESDFAGNRPSPPNSPAAFSLSWETTWWKWSKTKNRKKGRQEENKYIKREDIRSFKWWCEEPLLLMYVSEYPSRNTFQAGQHF